MSGYSGTPLLKKLGFRTDMQFHLVNLPADISEFSEFGTQNGINAAAGATMRTLDYIHIFETRREALDRDVRKLCHSLKPEGMIWVSWPKKASKVPTSITEDVIRELLLPLGLVDVKVAAINEIWSGLKLVWRKELRAEL